MGQPLSKRLCAAPRRTFSAATMPVRVVGGWVLGTVCRKRSSSVQLSKTPVVESVETTEAWSSQDRTGEASCSQDKIAEKKFQSGDEIMMKERTGVISVETEVKELELWTLKPEVDRKKVIETEEPLMLDSIA